MKKLVKIVSVVAALALSLTMMTGCKSSVSFSENDTTANGITKTVRTETADGKTTTTVTYTDATGNTLSAEEGEAAFSGTGTSRATAAQAHGFFASAEAESAEPEKVTASLRFENLSGRTITALYVMTDGIDPNDPSAWGENLLSEPLDNDMYRMWDSCITYNKGVSRQFIIHFADAEEGAVTVFPDMSFDEATDPTNLTFRVTVKEDGTGYSLTRV